MRYGEEFMGVNQVRTRRGGIIGGIVGGTLLLALTGLFLGNRPDFLPLDQGTGTQQVQQVSFQPTSLQPAQASLLP